MSPKELIAHYPVLYHMAEGGTWESIRERGLLSTQALLDLFELSGEKRYALESCHRPQMVAVTHLKLGTAMIRDQKPMSDEALRRCLLQGMQPREWYEASNRKVYFWLARERLVRLLCARAYRSKEHCVLTVDTARLVHRHLPRITLSPINSGCTRPFPQPRGPNTFLPVDKYPFEDWRKKRGTADAVVELAVHYQVPDIAELVVRVETMEGERILGTVWEAGQR